MPYKTSAIKTRSSSRIRKSQLVQHPFIRDLATREGITVDEAMGVVKRFYGSFRAAKEVMDEFYSDTNVAPVVGDPVDEEDHPYCTLYFDENIIVRFKATVTYPNIAINPHYTKEGETANIYLVTMTVWHPEGQDPPAVWDAIDTHGIANYSDATEAWGSDSVSETYFLRVGSVVRFSYGEQMTDPFVVPSPVVAKPAWRFRREMAY